MKKKKLHFVQIGEMLLNLKQLNRYERKGLINLICKNVDWYQF